MGRSLNQKCWACSLLTSDQARQQHGIDRGGDGCWKDAVCHSRRSYYRQGRGNRVRRQSQVSEVVVPVPIVSFVVLHTYVEKPRYPNDDVVIHAMCAELWVGEKPISLTQPQHTFGLPPRLVKDYARQLLEALYQQYGDGRRSGFELASGRRLCVARAEVLISQWEESSRDPIIEREFSADVVRQTMAVDLSDLLEPAPPRQRRTKSISKPEGSIVAPVGKAAVLAMVDQLKAEATAEMEQKQEVLLIAHQEDVTRWIQVIVRWLQAAPNHTTSYADLCHCLEISWVEVWLGILLGGFELEQRGELYQSPIWLKFRDEGVIPQSVL